ncbi:VOC family protein [Streptomyces sp. NPDC002596]
MTTPVLQGGLGHIAIRVYDIDTSVHFYTQGLGFRFVREWSVPQGGVNRAVFLDAEGDRLIELVDARSTRPAPYRRRAWTRGSPGPLRHPHGRRPLAAAVHRRANRPHCEHRKDGQQWRSTRPPRPRHPYPDTLKASPSSSAGPSTEARKTSPNASPMKSLPAQGSSSATTV